MFEIFKSFFGNASNDSQMATEVADALDELDVQMSISAHENWKLRLQAYLEGASSEAFEAESICFDDRCDLGKWIHSAGQERLGKYPGFTALTGHHKMFHYAASNVVALSKSGKTSEAKKMLDGQFASFSKSVVTDLHLLSSVANRSLNAKQKSMQM